VEQSFAAAKWATGNPSASGVWIGPPPCGWRRPSSGPPSSPARAIVVAAMDEATLLDRLRKIEALHAGATTEGERDAARADERIKARRAEQRAREPDIVIVYSLPDPWKRKLFLALCRRYGREPFRRPRQRESTVLVRAPHSFLQDTLWPEYIDLA
jgi:hypothetical protein